MTKEVAMTRYAVDPDRDVLTRTIPSRAGEIAGDVAPFPTSDSAARTRLAVALAGLSDALWAAYADPASDDHLPRYSPVGDDADEEGLDAVQLLRAVREPNLPEDGYLPPERFRTQAAAHEVGRILHAISDPTFRDAIACEIEAEIAAVDQAETGYYAERAAQAILLTRVNPSLAQVDAVFDALQENPFDKSILNKFDPHAASVAAAHWLLYAAHIASQASGIDAESIVSAADDLEMLPVETPSTVLSLQLRGSTPYEAVTALIGIALGTAAGHIPAPLVESLATKERTADRLVQISTVDPRRPAPNLIEDLLEAIEGAFQVWDEHDDTNLRDDISDEEWEAHQANRRTTFVYLVEDAANEHKSRLGLR